MTVKKSVWVIPYHEESNSVLIARRSKNTNNGGLWNFFGGGVDKGETPIASAVREFGEEANMSILEKHLEHIGTTKGTTNKNSYNAYYFMLESDRRFIPDFNTESDKAKWLDLNSLLSMKQAHFSILGSRRWLEARLADKIIYEFGANPFPTLSSVCDVEFEERTTLNGGLLSIKMNLEGQAVASADVMVGMKKLVNFHVYPDFRRRGLARKLLNHIVENANIDNLVAQPANNSIPVERLIDFYASCGFKVKNRSGNRVEMTR